MQTGHTDSVPAMLLCDLCNRPLQPAEIRIFALPMTSDEPGPKAVDLRLHELCAARMRREVG